MYPWLWMLIACPSWAQQMFHKWHMPHIINSDVYDALWAAAEQLQGHGGRATCAHAQSGPALHGPRSQPFSGQVQKKITLTRLSRTVMKLAGCIVRVPATDIGAQHATQCACDGCTALKLISNDQEILQDGACTSSRVSPDPSRVTLRRFMPRAVDVLPTRRPPWMDERNALLGPGAALASPPKTSQFVSGVSHLLGSLEAISNY